MPDTTVIEPVHLIDTADLTELTLPPIHYRDHQYAFFLHDAMVAYLLHARASGMLEVTVHLQSSDEEEEFGGLTGSEQIADWLETRRPDDYDELMRRQAFGALLGDALHFLFEALTCSAKGKLTVAYALLRKPFRENLFLLELLLADPERFVRVMKDKSNDRRRLEHLTQAERGRAIIRGALRRLDSQICQADFLYDLRYGKKVHYSLESLWNKATHLVTSHQMYATESMNLNFVFSDAESHQSQWLRFYHVVPFLLFYFSEVVIANLKHISDGAFAEPYDMWFRRVNGFILWGQSQRRDELGVPNDSAPAVVAPIQSYTFECPNCGQSLLGSEEAVETAVADLSIYCAACGIGIRVGPTGLEPALGSFIRSAHRERWKAVLRLVRRGQKRPRSRANAATKLRIDLRSASLRARLL